MPTAFTAALRRVTRSLVSSVVSTPPETAMVQFIATLTVPALRTTGLSFVGQTELSIVCTAETTPGATPADADAQMGSGRI